jgi:aspartyl protease family protein
MLRKLILVGVIAGGSASVPILYQANPDGFEQALRSAVQGDEAKTRKLSAPIVANTAKPTEPVETLVGRKARLSADPNGHFLADFKLNGRSVNAMVDTGATLVAINRSTARRIGIDLKAADFRYQVSTANGNARAAGVVIDKLQIGRIAVGNVQAVVLEDEALNDTLIGMSFLKQLSKFQVEDGSLLLVQ